MNEASASKGGGGHQVIGDRTSQPTTSTGHATTANSNGVPTPNAHGKSPTTQQRPNTPNKSPKTAKYNTFDNSKIGNQLGSNTAQPANSKLTPTAISTSNHFNVLSNLPEDESQPDQPQLQTPTPAANAAQAPPASYAGVTAGSSQKPPVTRTSQVKWSFENAFKIMLNE